MNILITGATSMIGKALCKKLFEKHNIFAVVRKNSTKTTDLLQLKNISIIECNMNNYGSISNLISEQIDLAVLMAWNGTRGSDRNDTVLQSENYNNNIAILDELKKLGCKKIITAGSQAEYGHCGSDEKVTEDFPSNPNTEYGKYKLKFYNSAKVYCDNNNITLVEPRIFSIYGPDDYENTLIMSMIKKMILNEPCDLTECIQKWDYLYIDDAINALVCLIESDCSGIYNIGYGDSIIHDLKYYIEIIHKLTNSKSSLNFGAISYPETGKLDINPSVNKLKNLGWKPTVDFQNGIEEIIKLFN